MILHTFGENRTEIQIGNVAIFFSYSTPVACYIGGMGYFRTMEKHSNTTTKHINKWLGGVKYQEKPQEWFNSLLDGVDFKTLVGVN